MTLYVNVHRSDTGSEVMTTHHFLDDAAAEADARRWPSSYLFTIYRTDAGLIGEMDLRDAKSDR